MKKIYLITGLIVLLGFLTRFYHLATIPNGFFFDEATIAYQAYSLIKTGHDTWGTFLPLLSFKDYGEYILPLGIYWQGVWTQIFGLTVFAARLPQAFVGILITLAIIWIGRLVGKDRLGLIAGFLYAVSPLALGWNRFVFEGNLGTLFFLLGFGFLVRSYRQKNHFLWAVFFFGLAMLTYHIFLVTVPVFELITFLLVRPTISKKTWFWAIIIGLFFSLWVSGSIISGSGRARFSQASKLISESDIDVLNHQIGYCRQGLPDLVCRIFGNKYLLMTTNYLGNFVGHFSPNFLGFDGTFLRRNLLPQTGLVLPIELLSLALGSYLVLSQIRDPKSKLLLLWLAVYPLSNSFTGVGEISRIAFAAPLLCLLSGLGINYLISKNKILALSFSSILLFEIVSFFIAYFQLFPITNAYYTNYGYDKVYQWIRAHGQKYDHIYITSSYAGSLPAISAMFFLPINPADFQTPGSIERYQNAQGYYVISRIRNLYFFPNWTKLAINKNDFLIVSPGEIDIKKYDQNFDIIDPTGRRLLIGLSPKT